MLRDKSLYYYVHHALNQPHFVDAGQWMLYSMVKADVIEKDGNTYRFCRMTPARSYQLKVIPRAVHAMYHLMTENDRQFSNSEGENLRRSTVESVGLALSTLEW